MVQIVRTSRYICTASFGGCLLGVTIDSRGKEEQKHTVYTDYWRERVIGEQ